MPLRSGAENGLTTASAPPQPKAIYQRPLTTKSAPAIAEEPLQNLPSNAFFPSNPWQPEEEGKNSIPQTPPPGRGRHH